MTELGLDELVANGSVAEGGAEVLRSIGGSGASFLVHSMPRNAGKSTVMEAVLAAAPAGTACHEFFGTEAERAALASASATGYLVVAEMGHRGRLGYLAGEEVRRVFDLVGLGHRLASSLHADTVAQVFGVLADQGIGAGEVAAGVRFLVEVQPLGDPFDPATRRIVAAIREVQGLDDAGAPVAVVRYAAPAR